MIPRFSFLFSFLVLSIGLLASSDNQFEEKDLYFSEIAAEKSDQPDNAKIKVKGTGKTIGDVILLEVTNRDKVNTLRFSVGPALVPGTRRSQPYIIPGTTEIVVQPGGTITVPIDGICIDPYKPPIRPGSGGPKFDDWIDIISLSDDWAPDPASGWNPDPNNPVLNPVTEEPIGHTIDIYSYPEEAAPLILSIAESIINTTDDLITDGVINTPITDNPTMERELIIQQTTWIAISGLTGNSYTVSEFETRVFDLIPSVNIPEEGSPEEEATQAGIQDFWNTFQAVGMEAKVLKESTKTEASKPQGIKSTTAPVKENDTDTIIASCLHYDSIYFDPPYAIDHKISSSWSTAENRRALIDSTEKYISNEIPVDVEEFYDQYDVATAPTSTLAFWRTNHIGGWASAYARAWLRYPDGRSEWIWNTEEMESNAEGKSYISLYMEPDEDCSSVVVGTSLSRILARGRVFDAVSGGHDNSLPVLRAYTWLGKKAVQFLIERRVGKTKDGFFKYIKDQATEEVKDALKEKLKDKANEIIDDLLAEMGIEIDGDHDIIDDIPEANLKEWLEEWLGINIPSLSDGIDAAFNLFFWSNTYATAFGAMNISVGTQSGTVQAQVRNLYLGQGLEDSEEAVLGMNDQLDELILSDAHPSYIGIEAWGLSSMSAKADGNGHARAELYSLHLELIYGICICPNKQPLIAEVVLNGWYQPPRSSAYAEINYDITEKFREDITKSIQSDIKNGRLDQDTELNEWKNRLEESVSEWSANNSFGFKN